MLADVKKLEDAGKRLAPDAVELLLSVDKEGVVRALLENPVPIISADAVLAAIAEEGKIPQPVEVKRASGFAPISKEHSPRLRVIERQDISGKSRCTGTIEDFVEHFQDRFKRVGKMLKNRISANPVVETERLKENQGKGVRLICMVAERRDTKKGDLLLTVEDGKGTAKVFVSKREKCFLAAKGIADDEIIAVDGKYADPFLIASEITWPDLPVVRERKHAEEDLAVAYISDLHIGSRHFLEKEFANFLSWLNGKWGDATLAGKVKYVEIGGDIVDGIGVYPSQEKDLVIKDIYKQYEMFDELIVNLPDYVEVIVSPGNHDAVRRADPQPIIPMELMKADVKKVGSPSLVEIEGLKHLIYHGTSLDSVIAGIPGLSYNRPEEAMLALLKRRHLSPLYGDNLIVPEKQDVMVIEEEPDVLHMGHVHKNGHLNYRGTVVLNSGTFQARTEYQERMGHIPTPGKAYVMELKSGNLNMVDFGEPGQG
jgi:DNA polymerase II small subunit